MTVTSYLRTWLEIVRPNLASGTYAAYVSHVEHHIGPAIGRIHLRNLTAAHIEAAKQRWLTTPRPGAQRTTSARTAHHVFSTLRTALRFAVRSGRIAASACDAVRGPRFERRDMRSLDARGIAALLRTMDETPIGAAVTLAVGSGLRRGELLALRWGDIDLRRGVLAVRYSLVYAAGVAMFKTPKTRRSRRALALPAFVVRRLREHRITQACHYAAVGLPRPTLDTLLFERNGLPIVPNTFSLRFARYIKSLGLPRVRLHDLRHSFASVALASGVDLKTVSAALGHASIAITADTYVHVQPAMLTSAAARVHRAITGAMR